MSEKSKPNTTFIALDLDRTLIDTDKITEALHAVVEKIAPFLSEGLRAAQNETESKGQSFAMHEFLREHLKEQEGKIAAIESAFLSYAAPSHYLNDGADLLLETLKSHDFTFGIITFGDLIWQTLKLQASGLTTMPVLITDRRDKGNLIADWRQEDGSFVVPLKELEGSFFDTIVLADDKALSFEGFPTVDVRGYHYQPLHNNSFQQAHLPYNVTHITHLSEISDIEIRHLKS